MERGQSSKLSRVLSCLQAMEPERRKVAVSTLHDAIGQTGLRHSPAEEVRMEDLGRRCFYLALKIGVDLKAAATGKRKAGVARLCWKELAAKLESFRKTLGLDGAIGEPTDKDVDHFSTMRVRRRPSLKPGFYLLVALYILSLEEAEAFGDPFYQGLVHPDAMLAEPIWLLLARRLNDEAEANGVAFPFEDVKRPRAPVSLRSVTQSFFVHDHLVERMMRVFGRCVSPIDSNAHLAVYRMRQSDPHDLMKSFMAWKPGRSAGDLASLHIYKGPKGEGGTTRSSPGRVIPLDSGLFIIGGQRPEAMRKTPQAGLRPAPAPFRSLELMFFPWNMLDGSHLFPGLILSQNDKGAPLVGHVCARPIIASKHDDIEIGAVPIAKLVASLEHDRDFELEALGGLEVSEDVIESHSRQVTDIYQEYGSITQLARRIVEACNNQPPRWKSPVGFKADGKVLTPTMIERLLESAFSDVTHVTDSEKTFNLLSDLLFAPLTRS